MALTKEEIKQKLENGSFEKPEDWLTYEDIEKIDGEELEGPEKQGWNRLFRKVYTNLSFRDNPIPSRVKDAYGRRAMSLYAYSSALENKIFADTIYLYLYYNQNRPLREIVPSAAGQNKTCGDYLKEFPEDDERTLEWAEEIGLPVECLINFTDNEFLGIAQTKNTEELQSFLDARIGDYTLRHQQEPVPQQEPEHQPEPVPQPAQPQPQPVPAPQPQPAPQPPKITPEMKAKAADNCTVLKTAAKNGLTEQVYRNLGITKFIGDDFVKGLQQSYSTLGAIIKDGQIPNKLQDGEKPITLETLKSDRSSFVLPMLYLYEHLWDPLSSGKAGYQYLQLSKDQELNLKNATENNWINVRKGIRKTIFPNAIKAVKGSQGYKDFLENLTMDSLIRTMSETPPSITGVAKEREDALQREAAEKGANTVVLENKTQAEPQNEQPAKVDEVKVDEVKDNEVKVNNAEAYNIVNVNNKDNVVINRNFDPNDERKLLQIAADNCAKAALDAQTIFRGGNRLQTTESRESRNRQIRFMQNVADGYQAIKRVISDENGNLLTELKESGNGLLETLYIAEHFKTPLFPPNKKTGEEYLMNDGQTKAIDLVKKSDGYQRFKDSLTEVSLIQSMAGSSRVFDPAKEAELNAKAPEKVPVSGGVDPEFAIRNALADQGRKLRNNKEDPFADDMADAISILARYAANRAGSNAEALTTDEEKAFAVMFMCKYRDRRIEDVFPGYAGGEMTCGEYLQETKNRLDRPFDKLLTMLGDTLTERKIVGVEDVEKLAYAKDVSAFLGEKLPPEQLVHPKPERSMQDIVWDRAKFFKEVNSANEDLKPTWLNERMEKEYWGLNGAPEGNKKLNKNNRNIAAVMFLYSKRNEPANKFVIGAEENLTLKDWLNDEKNAKTRDKLVKETMNLPGIHGMKYSDFTTMIKADSLNAYFKSKEFADLEKDGMSAHVIYQSEKKLASGSFGRRIAASQDEIHWGSKEFKTLQTLIDRLEKDGRKEPTERMSENQKLETLNRITEITTVYLQGKDNSGKTRDAREERRYQIAVDAKEFAKKYSAALTGESNNRAPEPAKQKDDPTIISL